MKLVVVHKTTWVGEVQNKNKNKRRIKRINCCLACKVVKQDHVSLVVRGESVK